MKSNTIAVSFGPDVPHSIVIRNVQQWRAEKHKREMARIYAAAKREEQKRQAWLRSVHCGRIAKLDEAFAVVGM